MARCLLATLLTLTAACAAVSQTLQIQGSHPAPSTVGTAVVANNTADGITYALGCSLNALTTDGSVTSIPLLSGLSCDMMVFLAPGTQHVLNFVAPAIPGSYLLLFSGTYAGGRIRACTRLDVGNPPSPRPEVFVYPTNIVTPAIAHAADFIDPGQTPWEIANVGPSFQVFGPSDVIRILAPGGTTALANLPLGGIAIMPGGVVEFPLPLWLLPPAPYTVEASWLSPVTGLLRSSTHGIRPQSTGVDLHMIDGKDLRSGLPLRVNLVVTGPVAAPGSQAVYALLLGFQPGTTVLPGGAVLPLSLDYLVIDCATGNLGGLLTNHIGALPAPAAPMFPSFVGNTVISHPGQPVGGVRLRVAAVVLDPTSGILDVSQPELITVH